jgi:DNA-binding response OmpR family regulator
MMAHCEQWRVLLVEDNAPMRRLIALWLRRSGFIVLEASHASQAVVVFRRPARNVHLAIIDVMGTGGLDLAAYIGREHRAIPILYISGYVDSVAVDAIGWRSPESLLLKPFREHMLLARVRRLLAAHSGPQHRTVRPGEERSETPGVRFG